ncbi:MAG: glycosyltransferase family 2 protein [Phyllobacterium sp.]
MTSSIETGRSINICVCTYRRQAIADTLHSLGKLNLPEGYAVSIIVTDNDAEPSAKDRVLHAAATLPFPVRYVHAPKSNISIARNACLEASDGDFVAFIDDDETVSPDWLVRLVEVADATGADAVLGPAMASYGPEAPEWMMRGDFHSTFPVWVHGEIRSGYTCNVLLRRMSPHIEGRRFDLQLGRTGGEDTQYFTEVYRSGGKIEFAPEAWVHDPVPAGRARLSWLAKRRFRMGQTHGRLLATQAQGLNLAKQIGLAAMKAGYCHAAALAMVFSATRRNRYALRGIMHGGVISGLIGVREIQLYGEESALDIRGGKSGAT